MILPLLAYSLLSAADGPEIRFAPDSINFGNLVQGDTASARLAVQNRGNRTLIITKANPACECTEGRLSKDTLAPGDTATLYLHFNSASVTGRQEKSFTISSNDPVRPTVRLFFTAEVKPVWECEPSMLAFYSTGDGITFKEKEIVFTIRNLHKVPLTSVMLIPSIHELSFDEKAPLGKPILPGKSIQVKMRVTLKEPLSESIYGYMEVRVAFADKRSLTRKIGVAIRK